MRTNIMNFLAVTALAAAALFAPVEAKAANGAWSVVGEDDGLGTVTYGISMTTTGATPVLPLEKATSRIDQLTVMGVVSGTGTVTTKGVMASDIGNLTALQLASQPSATLVGTSPSLAISGTTGGDYRTLTNSNGMAGLTHQVTVPASSRVDIYVTEFNGKVK